MIEAGNVCVRGDEHEVKVEDIGGGGMIWEMAGGGKKNFYSLLTQSSSGMKNAWNISQEHNYLHGSEDWSSACNPPWHEHSGCSDSTIQLNTAQLSATGRQSDAEKAAMKDTSAMLLLGSGGSKHLTCIWIQTWRSVHLGFHCSFLISPEEVRGQIIQLHLSHLPDTWLKHSNLVNMSCAIKSRSSSAAHERVPVPTFFEKELKCKGRKMFWKWQIFCR